VVKRFRKTLAFVSLFAMVSLLGLPSVVATGTSYTNVVANWNAEAGGTPDYFSRWSLDPDKAEFEMDSEVKHGGSYSLRLSHGKSNLSSWYQRIDNPLSGATYRAEGWIKTSGVSQSPQNRNAGFSVQMRDAQGDILAEVDSASFHGRNDWTHVGFDFTVVAGTDHLTFGGHLWDVTGTVWFDDFSLTREMAVNRSAEDGSGSPADYMTWTDGVASFVWDGSTAHDGSKSLKISHVGATQHSAWYQIIADIEQGKTYELGGWIKTDGVVGIGAFVGVDVLDGSGGFVQTVDTATVAGTNGWTWRSVGFTSGNNAAQARLAGRLWEAEGSAWFDGFSFREQTIRNGGVENGGQEPDDFLTWSQSPGDASFTWDGAAAVSSESMIGGHRSLKIAHTAGTSSGWYQSVPGLAAGKRYKLTGWVKTENVVSSGFGAAIGVDIKDASYDNIAVADSSYLVGSNDWTYVTSTFTVPAGTAHVFVVGRLWDAEGAAWFDAIKLIEVGEEVAEPVLSGAWWDNWPRFSANQNNPWAVTYTEANVINGMHGFFDEGRAPFFRQDLFSKTGPSLQYAQQEGIKKLAWIEGMGDTRATVAAVHELGGGAYEWDPATDAPKLISHYWNWDDLGNGVNPDANKVVWTGTHSFANQEPWQGQYVRPNTFPQPTYPNGAPAVGYLDGSINPAKAKLYDANGGKDINGNLAIRAWGPGGSNTNGLVSIDVLGQTYANIGDISIAKDMASDWWVEYNVQAARWFIDHGADGFWVDNYSGYDDIGRAPVEVAFGDWSVAKFRDFLDDHPEAGVANPASFDIRAYLFDRFETWFPGVDPTALTAPATLAKWQDSVWLGDPVWRAYLSFKAGVQLQSAANLYSGIKEQAGLAGKDPDDIYVGGNDIPIISFGSAGGEELDMVNFEYMPHYSPVSEFSANGLAPYGHAGPLYGLASNFAKSRHANVWFYLLGDNAQYQGQTSLGEVAGYEALAHNVFINSGEGIPLIVGTDESAKTVNRTIKRMAPIFDKRVGSGKVGLVYSTQSEFAAMTPGGFADGGQIPHVLAYYGWGQALEDLNVPYRAIPDFRLTAEQLEDLDVLILPHIKSISQDIVDDVLIPFHNNGGTIVVTGTDSGSIGMREALYLDNASPLLYDLTLLGDAQFVTGNPGADYYAVHLTPGVTRTAKLSDIKTIVDGLVTNGDLTEEVSLSGFGDFVLTTLNYDAAAVRFFIDLTNVNIDKSTDTITGDAGGTITVKLPQPLQGKTLSVRYYDSDDEGGYDQLSYSAVDSATIAVTVPAFRVYGSLVIEED